MANTSEEYLDVKCYYSPHFTYIILSEIHVLRFLPCAPVYSGWIMIKYFELNDKKVNKGLFKQKMVNTQHKNKYYMDCDTCTLTCIHNKSKNQNIEIPDIVS